MRFPPAFVQGGLDALDRAQQRFRPTAFGVGVIKRYGDDRGGMYAALITFYGLLAVFPLLLLFVTFTSMVLGKNSEATRRLTHSALSQFPVIGDKLASSIGSLSSGSIVAFVASALFLLWGALGVTSALQMAANRAWRRPRHEDPNLWIRTARGLLLLGVIAASVVLITVLVGVSTSGYLRQFSELLGPALILLSLLVNLGAYYLALRILAPPELRARELLPGVIVGGVGWTALQNLGSYLLNHQLQRTSAIYGFFAIVLGLIFWLNLGAQLFIYATEVNVVSAEHAWPRGLFEASDEVKAELDAPPRAPEG